MFLHGSGSTGDDGKKQVSGISAEIRRKEKEFPAIVVFPQSQKRSWRADSEDGKRAMAILAEAEKNYKVDDKRVYLTGLSMGGFGTWSLAAAHPDKWAAIVPICGGGDVKSAAKIKDLPCWCFHGDADPTVKVDLSRNMIKAIKDAGGSPKYTEYPGVEHNSWTKAYGTKELYDWLWEQKRK
jgi:predicted peptidase